MIQTCKAFRGRSNENEVIIPTSYTRLTITNQPQEALAVKVYLHRTKTPENVGKSCFDLFSINI